MKRYFIFLLACCAAVAAHAHLMQMWEPDELEKLSDVVCNGTPQKVEETGEKANKDGYPMRYMSAKIKVIGKGKGEVADEIVLKYWALDFKARPEGMISPPHKISLEAGKRYHFYLKKSGDGYVGALDGRVDDGPSVEALGDKEEDTSPPLWRKGALDIATEYYLKQAPGAKIDLEMIGVSCFGDWHVTFRSPEQDNSYVTKDAEIIVTREKTIDPQSWIGAARAVAGARVDGTFIGKKVRIMMRKSEKQENITYVVLGTVEKMDGETITGNFSTYTDNQKFEHQSLRRELIESAQPLLELH